MNKTQLVEALAERIGDKRTAASAVDGVLDIIVDTVGSGGSVTLTGFGVFEARARAARVARNPRTGETVPVPATTVPAFRPGTAFKVTVSGGDTGAAKAPARRTRSTAAGTGTTTRRGAAARPATRSTTTRSSRSARASGTFVEEAPAPAAKKPAAKKAEKPEKAATKKAAEKSTAKAKDKPAKKAAKSKK